MDAKGASVDLPGASTHTHTQNSNTHRKGLAATARVGPPAQVVVALHLAHLVGRGEEKKHTHFINNNERTYMTLAEANRGLREGEKWVVVQIANIERGTPFVLHIHTSSSSETKPASSPAASVYVADTRRARHETPTQEHRQAERRDGWDGDGKHARRRWQ